MGRSLFLFVLLVVFHCALGRHYDVFHPQTTCNKLTDKADLDQAEVTVRVDSELGYVTVRAVSDNCFRCSPTLIVTVEPGHACYLILDAKHPTNITVVEEATGALGQIFPHFGDRGEYTVLVTHGEEHTLNLVKTVTKAPNNIVVPVVVATIVVLVLIVIWNAGEKIADMRKISPEKPGAYMCPDCRILYVDLNSEVFCTVTGRPHIPQDHIPKKRRLNSLDTFRGMSLMIMIFVNYGGGQYWWLDHSRWNGLTVADLVFPWFIFMMGVSSVFALKTRKDEDAKTVFLDKILRRSCTLFALGLFLNTGGGTALNQWRIPGVLQRFGISYFVVTTVTYFVPPYFLTGFRATDEAPGILERYLPLPYWRQWAIFLSIHMIWVVVTFATAIPGCPKGYIGPGGLSDFGAHYNCTGGAAGYIDRQFFTDAHIYQSPTCLDTYHNPFAFDPEGMLGSLNSIFLCFLGVTAGRILITYEDEDPASSQPQVIGRLVGLGLFWTLLAGFLCGFSKNLGVVPSNKNLWSPTFIYITGGTGYMMLALMYYIIDVKGWWAGAPLTYPGMNSIAVYFCSEAFQSYVPFSFTVPNTHGWQLFGNLFAVWCWICFAFGLKVKGIFVAL